MKVYILIASMFLVGCEESLTKYVDMTNGKVIPYASAYCRAGLVFNNDMENIFGADGLPATCNGYIRITIDESIRRNAATEKLSTWADI
ncbi:MAG: hypothetical protein ACTSWQ_04595 [Candidatus Thorarchaeota archaeon]